MFGPGGYRKAPEHKYATMPDNEIKAMPVHLLAAGDCTLFMWATWPRLPLALEVMHSWGFRYVTGGAWVKRTRKGKLRWGPGYWLRTVCEPWLIGCIGETQREQRNIINLIEAEAREHSRKPPECREVLARLTPYAWRCELFAREPWEGNDVWGLETEKFETADA
jgi:N6-adenosine-specific RNA methylase IME4